MQVEAFFQIVLTTETETKPLQGFRCQQRQIAYNAAVARLDYWAEQYPNGIVDIVEIQ